MTTGNQTMASKKIPSTPRDLIKITTVAYTVMAVVGFEICWWYHQNVANLLGKPKYEIKAMVVIVVVGILFLHICQRLMDDFFPTYKKFKVTLSTMFSGISWLGAFWLALTSSVAEEILFRGAIQPFLGIWFTSFLFGLLHLDPEGGVSVWTAWAVIAGILLGTAVDVTGSLWPAIVIHFVVNFIGIYSLSKIKVAV